MAKDAEFKIGDSSFKASLNKVDRNKVYGWVESKYLDKNGDPCIWATLLPDGKTLVATGGTALKTLTPEGEEVSKSELVAIHPDGSKAELQKSIYEDPVVLNSKYDIDDLLRMEIKSVYQLSISEGADVALESLKNNKVLYLKFNYRTDYEADDAFLIAQGENIFILTGILQDFQYSMPDKPAVVETEEVDSSSEIDFNMF
jgi:hypothetical protein